MGLLDKVMTASGEASCNYLNGDGVTIGKIALFKFRDKDDLPPGAENLGNQFRIDIDVIHSTQPCAGERKTVNDNFKQPGSALSRMRRACAVAKSAAEGRVCTEADQGLTRLEGEDDKAFNKRCSEEIKRLVGPTQPLVGTLVKIITTGGKNQTTGNPYTLFELVPLTAQDLEIPAVAAAL